jgi:hypothetical protein
MIFSTINSIFLFLRGRGVFEKTWCSLYIVWHFIYLRKTVVYEVSEKKVVFVVHSDCRMRMCAAPAFAAIIPELENLGDSRAIQVFDASASVSSEPAQSNAFLILTSSRNNCSCKQTERRSVHRCVIPSYTLEELQLYCQPFDVICESVASRYFEIGPSFRYILTGNYALIKKRRRRRSLPSRLMGI